MHPGVEIFWLRSLFPLSIWLLLHVSCCSLVPLSLILAKRLIASLKHYKRILEIYLQLILSNLEVRYSVIWVGKKTKELVVYVKVNWHPLTNVWGQFSSELTSTLFVCLSTPKIGVLTGIYFVECQVPDCPRWYAFYVRAFYRGQWPRYRSLLVRVKFNVTREYLHQKLFSVSSRKLCGVFLTLQRYSRRISQPSQLSDSGVKMVSKLD